AELAHLAGGDHGRVRGDLQAPARREDGLAGCLAGGRGHLALLHSREVPHRPLSRQERGRLGLWGGGLPRHHRRVGVLLRPDPPLRRRVHQGLADARGGGDARRAGRGAEAARGPPHFSPDPAAFEPVELPGAWPSRPWIYANVITSRNGIVTWTRAGTHDDHSRAIAGGDSPPPGRR